MTGPFDVYKSIHTFTWIRERAYVVQMQGGNEFDYPCAILKQKAGTDSGFILHSLRNEVVNKDMDRLCRGARKECVILGVGQHGFR